MVRGRTLFVVGWKQKQEMNALPGAGVDTIRIHLRVPGVVHLGTGMWKVERRKKVVATSWLNVCCCRSVYQSFDSGN